MEEFGSLIAERIIAAVREAQAKNAQAKNAAPATTPPGERPGSAAPPGQGRVAPGGGKTPLRRAPNFGAVGPAAAQAQRGAAPVRPAPPQRIAPPAAPAPLTFASPPPMAAPDAAIEPIESFASLDVGSPAAAALASSAPPPSAPLLGAFANRNALLGAIVLGEALAPPLILRPGGAHREER